MLNNNCNSCDNDDDDDDDEERITGSFKNNTELGKIDQNARPSLPIIKV